MDRDKKDMRRKEKKDRRKIEVDGKIPQNEKS